ncbi:MAG: hypothetical protein PHT36_02085 [Patescibacteria group bacterium]|nr:hypothetical protein [Patescibacteria group bacterium]
MRERKRRSFSKGYKSNIITGPITISLLLVFTLLIPWIAETINRSQELVIKDRIYELQSSKTELEEERDRLRAEATRLQSIQEIEKVLNSSDSSQDRYVPVDKINYLPSTNVAVK